jgi:hypothetical protein
MQDTDGPPFRPGDAACYFSHVESDSGVCVHNQGEDSRFVLVQGPGTVRFCKESSIVGEIVGREISPPRCRWNHLRIAT